MGPKAEKEKTKTSPTQNKERGFTLVEILVVMAIIGAATALAITRINTRQNNVKALVRELSSLSRELHAFARLSQKTYRLALDLQEERPHRFWVESSSLPGANVEVVDQSYDDREKPKPTSFSIDKTVLKEAVELPSPLKFEDVELASRDKMFRSGTVYIHYLPVGMTEQAAIHITDGDKIRWTLLLDPLTGDLIPQGEYISLKETLPK